MLITLLYVLISHKLSLHGLTLPILFDWYCVHPFCFIFFIAEMLEYAKVDISKKEGWVKDDRICIIRR